MELVVIIGGVVAAVVLIVIGVSSRNPEDTLQQRLAEYSSREQIVSLEEIELSMPFSERVIVPVLRNLADYVQRFTPKRTLENARHNLDLAGNPYNWSPAEFFAVRGGAMIFLGVSSTAILIISSNDFGTVLGYGLLFAAVGFMLPALLLGNKIRARKGSIVKSLPDALDLLTVCVEAGLGFDQALQKVAEKWEDELSYAFARVIQEIQLGKVRREALRGMADRMDVTDVTSFMAAIIQAETLGVSVGKILRIQSDQMRMRRRQRAEEQAHMASIKMLIPMVFLIFPSIWVVLLGPAILQAMSSGAPGLS